jgi:tellurite resistance protein TerC
VSFFYGVLGALVFRAIFIAGGAVLIEQFAWVLYLFGAFLVFTGWMMFTHRNDEMDPSRNPVLRLVRKRVPSTDEYHGQKFWVKKAGCWVATPLFTVLAASVPATVTVTSWWSDDRGVVPTGSMERPRGTNPRSR